jgi:glycyl-tRNA synthetase beta chain
MPDLLVELFSEEIPARMQARAAADLRRLVTDGLVEAGLTYAHATAHHTPRRLALAVEGLSPASATTREERRGPKFGAPEKAVEGFAKGAGVLPADLEARETPKGQFWFATVVSEGRPAAAIVAEVLEATIRGFPWPKSMRWGAGSLRWVRPLHRILCILSDEAGSEVVPVAVDGLRAGDLTEGHRFLAPGAFSVSSFEDYVAKLKRARVRLSAQERAEAIRHDIAQAAFAQGLTVVEDQALLEEVAGLVEWPVVLVGGIDAAFLGLPPEVLRTSMREHQKFFSLAGRTAETGKNLHDRDPGFATSWKNAAENVQGQITHFATVANRETADDGATILAGNSRVLAARLADAAFFWENDLAVARAGMEPWRAALAEVTFHARLGSQAERIDRVAALAREIAPSVGADPDLAARAAEVAKLDLASEMVFEFPELQGVMGRYYAAAAGEPPEVAAAAEAHYAPLGPSDAVPTEPVSVAVALADKLDTLTGFWAIDEKPTGSKDPFALRRAALGVIRLVLENAFSLRLLNLISWEMIQRGSLTLVDAERTQTFRTLTEEGRVLQKYGLGTFPGMRARHALEQLVERAAGLEKKEAVEDYIKALDLLSFLHDRLKVHLREQGIRHDVIDACLAMPGNDDLTLLVKRAEALSAVLATEDGGNLVQGFRRANNILTQAEGADGVAYEFGADRKWMEAAEEVALMDALDAADAVIGPAMEAEDFTAAMAAMAGLRGPIDAFFEAVQVNTENQVVRRNRLNMLSRIRATCLSVADLTRLEG